DQEANLIAVVELTAAREVRREAAASEGVQHPGGIGVVPYEDREIAERPLGGDRRFGDPIGDRLGLLSAARELQVVDLDGLAGRAADELLVDAQALFEAVGIVPDEGVRRVEEILSGSAILDQGHDLRTRVRRAEG